jgi:hypothetical protein
MNICDSKTNIAVARTAVMQELLLPPKMIDDLSQKELCNLLLLCKNERLPSAPFMLKPRKVGKYMISVYSDSPFTAVEYSKLLGAPNLRQVRVLAEKIDIAFTSTQTVDDIQEAIFDKLVKMGVPEPIRIHMRESKSSEKAGDFGNLGSNSNSGYNRNSNSNSVSNRNSTSSSNSNFTNNANKKNNTNFGSLGANNTNKKNNIGSSSNVMKNNVGGGNRINNSGSNRVIPMNAGGRSQQPYAIVQKNRRPVFAVGPSGNSFIPPQVYGNGGGMGGGYYGGGGGGGNYYRGRRGYENRGYFGRNRYNIQMQMLQKQMKNEKNAKKLKEYQNQINKLKKNHTTAVSNTSMKKKKLAEILKYGKIGGFAGLGETALLPGNKRIITELLKVNNLSALTGTNLNAMRKFHQKLQTNKIEAQIASLAVGQKYNGWLNYNNLTTRATPPETARNQKILQLIKMVANKGSNTNLEAKLENKKTPMTKEEAMKTLMASGKSDAEAQAILNSAIPNKNGKYTPESLVNAAKLTSASTGTGTRANLNNASLKAIINSLPGNPPYKNSNAYKALTNSNRAKINAALNALVAAPTVPGANLNNASLKAIINALPGTPPYKNSNAYKALTNSNRAKVNAALNALVAAPAVPGANLNNASLKAIINALPGTPPYKNTNAYKALSNANRAKINAALNALVAAPAVPGANLNNASLKAIINALPGTPPYKNSNAYKALSNANRAKINAALNALVAAPTVPGANLNNASLKAIINALPGDPPYKNSNAYKALSNANRAKINAFLNATSGGNSSMRVANANANATMGGNSNRRAANANANAYKSLSPENRAQVNAILQSLGNRNNSVPLNSSIRFALNNNPGAPKKPGRRLKPLSFKGASKLVKATRGNRQSKNFNPLV